MAAHERRDDADPEYRLSWEDTQTQQPGIPFEADRLHGAWIGSRDPMDIKRFAAGQGWPDDKPLEVELMTPGAAPHTHTVSCGPLDVSAWNPSIDRLPAAREMPPRPRSRSTARLDLIEALRRAADQAVDDGILGREAAAGLMLAVQDALGRHARARR